MPERIYATVGEPLKTKGLSISECVPPALLNLRFMPNAPLIERVAGVVGTAVPLTPNRFNCGEGRYLVWLGPDEWLVIAEPGGEAVLLAAIDGAMGNEFHSVVDVSGQYSVFDIQGREVRQTLSIGCSLDLDKRMFIPGQCAQTLLARAGILLLRQEGVDNFKLLCRRSFAGHVRQWLDAATSPYRADRP